MNKSFRLAGIIATLLGTILLVTGAVLVIHTQSFIHSALRTTGEVIHIDRSYGINNNNGQHMYSPVVKYTDQSTNQTITMASSQSSSNPNYSIGDKVTILYQPGNQNSAKIDTFSSLWLGQTIVFILGFVFFLFGIIFLLILKGKSRKSIHDLIQHGKLLSTQFSQVYIDTGVSVNGRSPFVILTQYHDSLTNKLRDFKSKRLWSDPSSYITDKQEIKVYVNKSKPKKYHMDISFLPAE